MCSRTFSVSGTRPTCSMAPSAGLHPAAIRIDAEDRDAAGIGPRQAKQDLDERGLAGSVRPQQGQQFAGPDFQIQIVQGDDVAITLLEIARPGNAARLRRRRAAQHLGSRQVPHLVLVRL